MKRWTGLIVCLSLLVGCGGGPEPQLEVPEEARQLFAQLEMERSLHRDTEIVSLAQELLSDYPDFPRNDTATLWLVRSAARLNDATLAVTAARAFPARFPASDLAGQVLDAGAAAAWGADRRQEAVELWAAAYDAVPLTGDRGAVADTLAGRLAGMELPDLEAAFAAATMTATWPLVGRELVRAQMAAGQPEAAAATVDELRQAGVTGTWFDEAIALVAGLPGAAMAGRLGVLCPLTDRYAVLGNAFYAGAQLALKAVDPFGEHGLELLVEDTAGDPVLGALAARKLCDEGCAALVGGLLSAPTATAALVAGHRGVPLVSPTATNHRIGLLGDHVLQTNLTGTIEVELLAQLAHDLLLKRRFAIVHPRTPEGEELATAFRAAVDSLGGDLVAVASFPPEATDFREPIRAIKAERPEVVFVPATVDQMVLLGPQIDFYQVGALVMGPSGWHAPKLLRRAGSVMERAVAVADQVLFSDAWSADFEDGWAWAQYPEDASALARSAYLATRLVLESMVATDLRPDRLREQLPEVAVDAAGSPGLFAARVKVVEDGSWQPFPAELYAAGWVWQQSRDHLTALADSLDSLPAEIAPTDTSIMQPRF